MDLINELNLSINEGEKENQNDAFHKANSNQTAKDEIMFILEMGSQESGLPIFKGEIDIVNAYESDFVGLKTVCPCCNASTQQMYSSFAYATDAAPRIMTGPVGHFCTKCPTVLIDDDMARQIIRDLYQYHGVFAVLANDTKFLFETINGNRASHVINESGQKCGILQSIHYIEPNPEEDGEFIYYINSDYKFPAHSEFSKGLNYTISQSDRKPPHLSSAANAKKKAKSKAGKKARKQRKK